MNQSNATVRDCLSFFSNGAGLREPMVSAISAVQRHQPHVQILALAAAVKVLCEGIGHDPILVLQQLERAKKDIRSPFAQQYEAMREYARGEFN